MRRRHPRKGAGMTPRQAETLAIIQERQPVAMADDPSMDETIAARAHLPTIARYTARAAARWARQARRPLRYQPQFVVDRVAQQAKELMERESTDPKCAVVLSGVTWLLLRSLLENLAWRFALWLFSDSTSEDRPDLICKMEAD